MENAFLWAQSSSQIAVRDSLEMLRKSASADELSVQKEYTEEPLGVSLGLMGLVGDALRERPSVVLAYSPGSFGSSPQEARTYSRLLEANGIRVRFIHDEPLGASVRHAAVDEIRKATLQGMASNAQQRDKVSGWCYKNGGRAPFGYRALRLDRGRTAKGKPIVKTIWEKDPVTAKVVRHILIDLYLGERLSLERLRDRLNGEGTPGPEGKPWGTSTLAEMLREDRIEQYAGTGFWNKEARGKGGSRFNPRDEWIRIPLAHPPIITETELRDVLERKATAKKSARVARSVRSQFLLTGQNRDGNLMFRCTSCGGSVIGYHGGRRAPLKYACSQATYRGAAGCISTFKVDKEEIENYVLSVVADKLADTGSLDRIAREIRQKAGALAPDLAQIMGFYQSLRDAQTRNAPEDRKLLARTFVDHVELDPKTNEVRIFFFQDLDVYR